MTDQAPLPFFTAWTSVARCIVASVRLLAAGRVHLPRTHVGQWLRFDDGSTSRVYQETVIDRSPSEPAVLVVGFRLRFVRGRGHDVFRRESVLNTPLFVGFPGFVSKLWLANDEHGVYRGLYQWDGPQQAEHYARPVAGSRAGQRSGLHPLPRTAGAVARRLDKQPAARTRR
jgi:hypothetical protein